MLPCNVFQGSTLFFRGKGPQRISKRSNNEEFYVIRVHKTAICSKTLRPIFTPNGGSKGKSLLIMPFTAKTILKSEIVWHFIGVCMINRTLHGRLEI